MGALPDERRVAGGAALAVRRNGPVVVATWDRQHVRNALDPATLTAVAATIATAADDPACRAIVLAGAGTIAFSAGMDLKSLAADRRAAGAAVSAWQEAIQAPGRPPLVAAVNGMAMGGGFEIALQCDLVVAADHASFGLPEVTRGIVPGGGGLQLGTRIPLPTALEIGLTGAPVSARRLYDLGFVNRVVPGEAVLDEALALAAAIAAHSPEVVATIRQGMWAAISKGVG